MIYNEIPPTGNKYFLNVKEGGLNPFTPRPTGSKLRFQNCTFYAAGCLAECSGVWITPTNAENFCAVGSQLKKLIVSEAPIHGALAVFRSGQIGNGTDGAGHVGQVIDVRKTFIKIGQSGWNANVPFWISQHDFKKNSLVPTAAAKYNFVGYLYPFSPLKLGSVGVYVKQLQSCLAALGYLRGTEIDGDFGRITLGGVCAYQLEHKECGDVDGIAGGKTVTSIAKAMIERL